MPGSDDDLVSIAEDLYAGAAPAFVAERTARAKAVRAAGDRDLAARITALPKPSASASLVNRLVHEGDDLDRVLALGAELRAAQEDGDRGRLRDLGARRRDLIAEVTRNAAERAERTPSASVLEEVQQTLQAVLIDEGAASAVGTGRLLHALTADGIDPADLTDAVGGPGGIRSVRPKLVARQDEDGDAERARQDAAAAAARAEDARRDADDAADRTQDAESTVQQRDETVQDVTAQLAELQKRLESAQHALDDARSAADEARSAEAEAVRAADDAEAAAAKLTAALGD